MKAFEPKDLFKTTLVFFLFLSLCSCKTQNSENEQTDIQEDNIDKAFICEEINVLPEYEWQKSVSFPDRLGSIDDTLAMNSIIGFEGYSGQGELYLQAKDVSSFDLFINSVRCEGLESDKLYHIDYSAYAVNGTNSLQVSNVEGDGKVEVYIPYPVLIEGTLAEEGFKEECFELISDIIENDIAYGFPSAQLAIIRHGKLVYNQTWGYLNSYDQNGNRLTDPKEANNDTMYDLASVTKMFSVNYAIQKLMSEGKINLTDKISDYLGDSFYEDTLDFSYDFGVQTDLDTQKDWKASLTVEDLLKHQGGFPPAPRYFAIGLDAPSQEYLPDAYNVLFAGYQHSEETKQATIKAFDKTPLVYEPRSRTMYSDVDYMILGVIVEMIADQGLDEYLKENFFEPLQLTRITYSPLDNGYEKYDCAATELNGNTRDGAVYFPGVREYTLQGEAHDEMAYYSMNGVSGHAGLFANAADLAKLAYLMFTGGYGGYKFFDRNVIDLFASPIAIDTANSGLGWARQGDDQRSWYFGSLTDSSTIGHQGWTGTLVMIDQERDIVMVYLTNERNTALTDKEVNANDFNGLYYTASTLGFVPEIFSIGLDSDSDVKPVLTSLLSSMVADAKGLIPDNANKDHPAYLNYLSKVKVYEDWIKKYGE
ncbi:MAG: serine hydrolase [Erysipelotrichaceae bacterium]|nr:serine hydrolase [Erysipelotrichaceae bacterium]